MFERVREILSIAFARHGITRYWLTDLTPEGLYLPGGAFPGEIEAVAGIVVLPDHDYRFWLTWDDTGYRVGGEFEDGHNQTFEEREEYNQKRILQLQQHMQNDPASGLHKPVLPPVREPGKPTRREQTLLWWWLASSRYFTTVDVTDYAEPLFETFEVLDVESGGHDLIGSVLPGEVQDITGILVLAQRAFHFRLSWIPGPWGSRAVPTFRNPGRYSLGEKDGTWRPVQQEECSEEQWQQLETIRHRLAEAVARLPHREQPTWTGRDDEIWPPDETEQPEQPGERIPRKREERPTRQGRRERM